MGGEDAQAPRLEQEGPRPPQDQGSRGKQARRPILNDHDKKLIPIGNKQKTVAHIGAMKVSHSRHNHRIYSLHLGAIAINAKVTSQNSTKF